MFVNINKRIQFEYTRGSYVEPLNIVEPVVVSVDPGKTSMGIIIGNEFGKIYNKINISAPGKEHDNVEYCYDFYDYLTKYLAKVKIAMFSLEEPVTEAVDRKRNKDTAYEREHKKKGNHITNKTLMFISAKMTDVAMQLTGRKPYMINNWVWKNAILPKKYRSGEYASNKKGSVPYIYENYPDFIGYPSDITDAMCMYLYVLRYVHKVDIYCDRLEDTDRKYDYIVTSEGAIPINVTRYKYNKLFTIEENLNYYINRLSNVGCFELPLERIMPSELIGHCAKLTTHSKPYLLVIPKEGSKFE